MKQFLEPKQIYNRLKQSAKKRNIEFTLTLFDIYNIDFPITCPILGIQMKWNIGKAEENSYSFDRIDSTKGYSFDNIQVISLKANMMKNNATMEELKKFSEFYIL